MNTMLWERRHSFRIPVTGKAVLACHGALDGLYDVDDVSIDGCSLHKRALHDIDREFIRSDSRLRGLARDRERSRVAVSIRVEGASQIEMPARVVRRSQSGGVAHLGLHFTKASPAF
ncbi:MAG TPA: PilZ domain-containing protein, partial [Polyangiales bacterium]|nr:PilZ domain-containing protein [Polyangiales bacterium]